jgi:hypothetical protein
VLSENRKLISVSFAAIIQTLKGNPEMANLIYNISIANNDKDNKNSNNVIANYFKANKHTLLDLAQKNYENLVEALTNNAINNATAASSNPALSLLSSSSIFRNPSNQSDAYKIEDPESFHDSQQGDIAE